MAEETIVQGLTPFQWSIIILFLIFILALLMGWIYYINRKHPQAKGKLDPLYKAVFIVAFIFILHLTAILFGVLEKESMKSSIWWYIGAAILLVGFYAIYVPYILKKPIPTKKLWKKYVLPDVRDLFQGEIYKGEAYVPPFLFSRVIPSKYSQSLQQKGIHSDLVEIFLIQVKFANIFFVLEIRDKFTGEGLEHLRDPPKSIVNELLGREVARSMEEPMQEYDSQPKITEQKTSV